MTSESSRMSKSPIPAASIGLESVASEGSPPLTIHKFSELEGRVQSFALEAIASINAETSTEKGKTWKGYTDVIRGRLEDCENAKNTLFIARKGDQVVGYCAFYTLKDEVYPSQFLDNDGQAYCSWTAVDKDFKGQGIASELKLQVFSPESGFTAFKGHIKRTNDASLRVLQKFAEKGYAVAQKVDARQVYYTVTKPS